jgi:hypothetical protein
MSTTQDDLLEQMLKRKQLQEALMTNKGNSAEANQSLAQMLPTLGLPQQQRGFAPMPEVPDMRVAMPSANQLMNQSMSNAEASRSQSGGLLKGILGNLASSYISNTFKKHQDNQDAKESGDVLSTGIREHAATLPEDSPIRKALNTISNMPHTPAGVAIMQNAYTKMNDALARNTEITSEEKNLANPAVVQRQDLIRAENKIPTAYMKTDTPGLIKPMNLPGGITYQDLQTQRMEAAKATPGWGQPEQLNLAINKDIRDEKRLTQQAQDQARRDSINAIKEKQLGLKQSQIDWKLDHPTYNNDMKEIQQSEADHAKLVASIDNYRKVLAKYPTQTSRHNPLANAELQNAYQSITWPARAKNMSNTGVMNVGEYPMLSQVVTNPSEFSPAGFRSNEELNKQLDSFISVSKTGHDALIKARTPDSPPPTMKSEDVPQYQYRNDPITGKRQRKRIN